jgi:hypothetical protein
MKKNLFALLTATILVVAFSGCYSTGDGHMKFGVAGPFAKDTISSRYERPVTQLLDAAKKVLNHNGTLTSDDAVTKTLVAKIDTRTVWVQVDEVEPNISRVRVQVRTKGGLGDIDLASEIDKQIALQLPR